MTVKVGYSAKTSERSERENAAEKQGQERHLGRTAISNKVQKRRKEVLQYLGKRNANITPDIPHKVLHQSFFISGCWIAENRLEAVMG